MVVEGRRIATKRGVDLLAEDPDRPGVALAHHRNAAPYEERRRDAHARAEAAVLDEAAAVGDDLRSARCAHVGQDRELDAARERVGEHSSRAREHLLGEVGPVLVEHPGAAVEHVVPVTAVDVGHGPRGPDPDVLGAVVEGRERTSCEEIAHELAEPVVGGVHPARQARQTTAHENAQRRFRRGRAEREQSGGRVSQPHGSSIGSIATTGTRSARRQRIVGTLALTLLSVPLQLRRGFERNAHRERGADEGGNGGSGRHASDVAPSFPVASAPRADSGQTRASATMYGTYRKSRIVCTRSAPQSSRMKYAGSAAPATCAASTSSPSSSTTRSVTCSFS